MGIFDQRAMKVQRDDFDSPVERIDLGASSSPTAGGASERLRVVPARGPESEYGIQKAIELMRTLPAGQIELVAQVVKVTLESARIDIGAIIEDASARQERIQSRIAALKSGIAELEEEIAQRRDEIGKLDADYAETSTVKDRLELAERLALGTPPAAKNDATVDAAWTAPSTPRPAPRPTPPAPPPRASAVGTRPLPGVAPFDPAGPVLPPPEPAPAPNAPPTMLRGGSKR